jgi:hypothetical protein
MAAIISQSTSLVPTSAQFNPPPLTKVGRHLYAVLPGTGKAFIATFHANNSHFRTFYGQQILSPSHFQSHISMPFRLKTEGDCSARFSVSVFFLELTPYGQGH